MSLSVIGRDSPRINLEALVSGKRPRILVVDSNAAIGTPLVDIVKSPRLLWEAAGRIDIRHEVLNQGSQRGIFRPVTVGV